MMVRLTSSSLAGTDPDAGGGGHAQRRLHVGHDAAGRAPQRGGRSPVPSGRRPAGERAPRAAVTGAADRGRGRRSGRSATGAVAAGAGGRGSRSRGRRPRCGRRRSRPAGSRRRTRATTPTPRWDRSGTGRTCPRPARRWVRTPRCRPPTRRTASDRRPSADPTRSPVPLPVRWRPSPSSLPGRPIDGVVDPDPVAGLRLASSTWPPRGPASHARFTFEAAHHAGLAPGEVPEPARPLLPARRHRRAGRSTPTAWSSTSTT